MLLKFHFELHFKVCTQNDDYHNTRYCANISSYYSAAEKLLIWIPLDMLQGAYSS